jgi:hypothetical protein
MFVVYRCLIGRADSFSNRPVLLEHIQTSFWIISTKAKFIFIFSLFFKFYFISFFFFTLKAIYFFIYIRTASPPIRIPLSYVIFFPFYIFEKNIFIFFQIFRHISLPTLMAAVKSILRDLMKISSSSSLSLWHSGTMADWKFLFYFFLPSIALKFSFYW